MRSAETGELYKATRLVMETREGRGIYDRMTTFVEPRDYEDILLHQTDSQLAPSLSREKSRLSARSRIDREDKPWLI